MLNDDDVSEYLLHFGEDLSTHRQDYGKTIEYLTDQCITCITCTII